MGSELNACVSSDGSATLARMAEERATLQEQLVEVGAQLDWVRDYL
jgi:hypothetical protein